MEPKSQKGPKFIFLYHPPIKHLWILQKGREQPKSELSKDPTEDLSPNPRENPRDELSMKPRLEPSESPNKGPSITKIHFATKKSPKEPPEGQSYITPIEK